MSMDTRSSDLEDQMFEASLQTEGNMGVESQCQKAPEEMGALSSSPLVPGQRATAQLS